MERIIEIIAEQAQQTIDKAEQMKLDLDEIIRQERELLSTLVEEQAGKGNMKKLNGWTEGRKPRGSGEVK